MNQLTVTIPLLWLESEDAVVGFSLPPVDRIGSEFVVVRRTQLADLAHTAEEHMNLGPERIHDMSEALHAIEGKVDSFLGQLDRGAVIAKTHFGEGPDEAERLHRQMLETELWDLTQFLYQAKPPVAMLGERTLKVALELLRQRSEGQPDMAEIEHFQKRAAIRDEAYTVLNGIRGMLRDEHGVCIGHESPAQIEQCLRHLLAKLEGDYAPQIDKLKETLLQQGAVEPVGVAQTAELADELIVQLVTQIRQLTDQRDDLTRTANDFYRKGVEAMRDKAESIVRSFLGPTVTDLAVDQLADESYNLTKGEQS